LGSGSGADPTASGTGATTLWEPAVVPGAAPERAAARLLESAEEEPNTPSLHETRAPLTPARAEVRPLSPGRYSLRVTISEPTERKLRRARDLLGHAVPTGDLAEVLDRALTVLLEQLERAKCGTRKGEPASPGMTNAGRRDERTLRRPRSEPRTSPSKTDSSSSAGGSTTLQQRSAKLPRSRYVAAAVRRRVWQRDEGRCTFVGPAGRCTRTRRLEFHHRVPFADGGAATVENLALACKVHNQWEAARWFGPEIASGRGPASAAGAQAPAADSDQSKSAAGPPALSPTGHLARVPERPRPR
jgi:5-methylcytosine-specific restriction endonuclease McrA